MSHHHHDPSTHKNKAGGKGLQAAASCARTGRDGHPFLFLEVVIQILLVRDVIEGVPRGHVERSACANTESFSETKMGQGRAAAKGAAEEEQSQVSPWAPPTRCEWAGEKPPGDWKPAEPLSPPFIPLCSPPLKSEL